MNAAVLAVVMMCAVSGMGQAQTIDGMTREQWAAHILDASFSLPDSKKCQAEQWKSLNCIGTAGGYWRYIAKHWILPAISKPITRHPPPCNSGEYAYASVLETWCDVLPKPAQTLGDEAQGYQVQPTKVTTDLAPFRTTLEWKATDAPAVVLDSNGHMAVNESFTGTVTVPSKTGRIDRLSDEEYARLEKLRKSLRDEEEAVAKAHGVNTYVPKPCDPSISCLLAGHYVTPADSWEIRGQFILVNVPNGVGR